MATGKSTVGRLVADRMGLTFCDLDELIVAEAGRSVAEIFRHEGEEGFRHRESQAVAKACTMSNTVVATGGGAACRELNLAAMLATGHVIALSATPAEVLRRTKGASGRPLLDGATDPENAARELLASREPFYAKAHHRIDTVGKSPAQVAEDVVTWLEAHP